MILRCVTNEGSNMKPNFFLFYIYIYTIYTTAPKEHFPTFFFTVMLYPTGPRGAYLGAKIGFHVGSASADKLS